jgi:pilus assembly protein CpaF
MKLRDRLNQGTTGTATGTEETSSPALNHELRKQIHERLIDEIDLTKLEALGPDVMRQELRQVIGKLVVEDDVMLNRIERERLVQELIDEVMGLGPLEALLADDEISDILINGCHSTFIEKRGILSEVPLMFRDDEHLLQIIGRIVSRVGRRIDESSPMVDARLPDGSRVNAIIPPLALDGPAVSIRRFGVQPLVAADLVDKDSITQNMLDFAAAAVRSKLNILISGGTGSGKTTLLNIMSGYIPNSERIVTIEDAAELQLQQRHVVRLETRPANLEGKGAVLMRDLVKNSLRMRPDRIIVGEVRGAEVIDMLQAMNTGHEGSLTTVHSNSPRDSIARLVTMAGLAVANFSENLMTQSVARALHLIIHVNRFTDGRRRIVSISEITGMEGSVITMQEIFKFNQTGIGEDGMVQGDFIPTGVRPTVLDHMIRNGYNPTDSFAL